MSIRRVVKIEWRSQGGTEGTYSIKTLDVPPCAPPWDLGYEKSFSHRHRSCIYRIEHEDPLPLNRSIGWLKLHKMFAKIQLWGVLPAYLWLNDEKKFLIRNCDLQLSFQHLFLTAMGLLRPWVIPLIFNLIPTSIIFKSDFLFDHWSTCNICCHIQ